MANIKLICDRDIEICSHFYMVLFKLSIITKMLNERCFFFFIILYSLFLIRCYLIFFFHSLVKYIINKMRVFITSINICTLFYFKFD